MRFITYVAIVALAATKGMRISCYDDVKFIFEPAVSVLATGCGGDAYKCVNPSGSTSDDMAKTRICEDRLKISQDDECWCHHAAEQYASVGDQAKAFQDCCESFDNFSWRGC